MTRAYMGLDNYKAQEGYGVPMNLRLLAAMAALVAAPALAGCASTHGQAAPYQSGWLPGAFINAQLNYTYAANTTLGGNSGVAHLNFTIEYVVNETVRLVFKPRASTHSFQTSDRPLAWNLTLTDWCPACEQHTVTLQALLVDEDLSDGNRFDTPDPIPHVWTLPH